MSASQPLVLALLTLGVLIQLMCCVGVLIMPGTYTKLHYLGPAGTIGPALIALAVIVQAGSAQASVKAAILAIIFLVSGPIISHATARAAKVRDEAGWDSESDAEGGA